MYVFFFYLIAKQIDQKQFFATFDNAKHIPGRPSLIRWT